MGQASSLPVRAASCRPFLAVDGRRDGSGNTGQGCPVNWQARMPAPHPPRGSPIACKKLRCGLWLRANLSVSGVSGVQHSVATVDSRISIGVIDWGRKDAVPWVGQSRRRHWMRDLTNWPASATHVPTNRTYRSWSIWLIWCFNRLGMRIVPMMTRVLSGDWQSNFQNCAIIRKMCAIMGQNCATM